MSTIKTAEQARVEWNNVWDSPFQFVIGCGRSVYNLFLRNVLIPHASPNADLLEIGCGTASLLCDIADRFRSVVGLDISERALVQARHRASQMQVSNVSFVEGDCFHLPFQDDSFDVLWSQGLHEHFENYIDIFKEEYRVCRPGGVVYAGVPYRYSYPTIWYKLSRLPMCKKLWPWTEQVFFTKNEILDVVRRVAPQAEVYVLQPMILGILIVKIEKPTH